MYTDLYNKCIEVLLRLEGGDKVSNASSDRGGLTRWGISQKSYPDLNIKALTKEKASDLYFNDYWIPMNLKILHDEELILHLFVLGVNIGIRTATKILQRLVGEVDDGYIGIKTSLAVTQYNGNLLEDFIKREKLFYITLAQKDESQHVNLKGWLARISNTHF